MRHEGEIFVFLGLSRVKPRMMMLTFTSTLCTEERTKVGFRCGLTKFSLSNGTASRLTVCSVLRCVSYSCFLDDSISSSFIALIF